MILIELDNLFNTILNSSIRISVVGQTTIKEPILAYFLLILFEHTENTHLMFDISMIFIYSFQPC